MTSRLSSILGHRAWLWACGLWLAACLAFYVGCYQGLFFHQAQEQLFLLTPSYVATYFSAPAWLSCLAGDFLTQFYYYRYAGPLILVAALALVALAARAALSRLGAGRLHALTALIVLAESVLTLHYATRLSSVLSLAGGLALFAAMPWRGRPSLSAAVQMLAIPLCFWLFGFGAMVLAALVLADVLMERRQMTLRLIALALPVACLGMARRCYLMELGPMLAYPGACHLVTSPADALTIEKNFRVAAEYQFGNLNRVVRMVDADAHHTDVQLFYYNLAMARRGQLPEAVMRHMPTFLGTLGRIGPQTPHFVIWGMDELYWALGDMTFCERAAIMSSVFTRSNRNIFKVRRLAEVNLVTGDTLAARKYLRLLGHTHVAGRWADRLLRADSAAMRPYMDKRQWINRIDTLRQTDRAHDILTELLQSNPDNRLALDYLLCTDLMAKDLRQFVADYLRFGADAWRGRQLPELYQQAFCLALSVQKAPPSEWPHYVSDPAIRRRFDDYRRERGHRKFSDTYWYYFDKSKIRK